MGSKNVLKELIRLKQFSILKSYLQDTDIFELPADQGGDEEGKVEDSEVRPLVTMKLTPLLEKVQDETDQLLNEVDKELYNSAECQSSQDSKETPECWFRLNPLDAIMSAVELNVREAGRLLLWKTSEFQQVINRTFKMRYFFVFSHEKMGSLLNPLT